MMTHADYDNGTLVMKRFYPAPQEAVFSAWIEAAKLEEWWGCADTTKVTSTVETKVGGAYEHEMTLRGQYTFKACGVFTEYDPPHVLAYTVPAAEDGGNPMDVRVEFTTKDTGTEVRLIHTGIPHQFSPFIVDGWTAAFGKLFRYLMQSSMAA